MTTPSMTNDEIIAKAKALVTTLKQPYLMATASPDGRPHIRWMGAFLFNEPFTIYLETFLNSRKVEDIRANPNVELLLSTPDFSQQVALLGTAVIDDNNEIRKEVYQAITASDKYFSGSDDPDLGVIRLEVKQVELWLHRDQREPITARCEEVVVHG